jgi:hypothetical protein
MQIFICCICAHIVALSFKLIFSWSGGEAKRQKTMGPLLKSISLRVSPRMWCRAVQLKEK